MNELENEIKLIIIESLNLEDVRVEDIASEDALFVDGLGLDSIDALELGLALQKKYGIKIQTQSAEVKDHFYSVRSLSNFISKCKQEG